MCGGVLFWRFIDNIRIVWRRERAPSASRIAHQFYFTLSNECTRNGMMCLHRVNFVWRSDRTIKANIHGTTSYVHTPHTANIRMQSAFLCIFSFLVFFSSLLLSLSIFAGFGFGFSTGTDSAYGFIFNNVAILAPKIHVIQLLGAALQHKWTHVRCSGRSFCALVCT